MRPPLNNISKRLKRWQEPKGAPAATFFCGTEKQLIAVHILPSSTQSDPPETRQVELGKTFDNLCVTTPAGKGADFRHGGKIEDHAHNSQWVII